MINPLRLLVFQTSEVFSYPIIRELEEQRWTFSLEPADSIKRLADGGLCPEPHLVLVEYAPAEFAPPASFLAAIRERWPVVPVVLIAHDPADERELSRWMQAGAQDYLSLGNLTRLAPVIERECRLAGERRRTLEAEKALLEAKSMHRAMLDSLGAELAVLDKDGHIVFFNGKWESAFHEPAASLRIFGPKGANYLDLLQQKAPATPNNEGARARAGISGVLQGHLPEFTLEYSAGAGDGERWFLLCAMPLEQGTGAVVSHIDVTERKRAEHDVYLLAQALRCTNDCVCLTDLEERILFVNDAFLKTHGYEFAELMGQPIQMVRSPRNQPELLQRILPATLHGGWNGEILHRKKDGSDIPLHLSSAVIRDQAGNAAACIGVANDISGRKGAEEALLRSEELQRQILEAGPGGIVTASSNGTVIQANQESERMLGLAAENLLGKSIADLPLKFVNENGAAFPGKDHPLVKCLESGQPHSSIVLGVVRPDQSLLWAVFTSVPLPDAATGRIAGAVLSFIDITDRIHAEEALRQSESRFRAVVESLSEGLLLTDLEDYILYANTRITELTGYTLSELVGHRAYELLFPPTQWSEAIQRYRRRSQGIRERYEVELCRKDKTTLWAEVSAAPLRNSQGHIVGTVGAITDISERRVAGEALQKSQASLLLAQRIGRVGSWESDLETGNLSWSEETYRIFGFDPETCAPTRDLFHQAVHPDDLERVRRVATEAIEGNKPYNVDHRIIRPDGSERILCEQAELVFDANDRPRRLVGTVQDITERKHLEEQLRLSQKMEAVGQLAGGIAHDFNNILTVIQGYADLINCNPYLDVDTRSQIHQIAQSAERAAKLTRQLLAFSRKQVMQLEVLHFNDLLRTLFTMLQRLLGEHIELQLSLDPSLPPIHGDVGMWEQVIINMTVNARDAMPKGGKFTIATGLQEFEERHCRSNPEAMPGRYVALIITDTGCGMAKETLAHIFEPFFTTKEVGKGTGLGLSTVYGIVKQHRGWIQVSSEPGHGSMFEIFVPAGAPEKKTARTDETNAAASGSGGSETILLVDDEPAVRRLAASQLRSLGYRVMEAGSGGEAISIWDDYGEEIDMLFTDMVMPGMTGHELAATLRERRPSLKVLFTSGFSVDFQRNPDLRQGVNFIPKPYAGPEMGRAVRKCLDRDK